jgi:hypothetical protein
VLGAGKYFFGIHQTSNQQLNIGFDRNINHNTALYYNVTGVWQQSGILGSLMIHPIFGKQAFTVGINELKTLGNDYFNIYPNPSSGFVNIENKMGSEKAYTIEVFSMVGEVVKSVPMQNERVSIELNDLSSGVYLVKITDGARVFGQQKLILSK